MSNNALSGTYRSIALSERLQTKKCASQMEVATKHYAYDGFRSPLPIAASNSRMERRILKLLQLVW
jgi:hypothetical protein